MVCVIVELP